MFTHNSIYYKDDYLFNPLSGVLLPIVGTEKDEEKKWKKVETTALGNLTDHQERCIR